MNRPSSTAVQAARDILAGRTTVDAAGALALVDRLKREYEFSYARRVLARTRRTAPSERRLAIQLGQQHALCTYRDIDIPAERRLERAFAILRDTDDPDGHAATQETLGIAGAIWKRRWDVTGRKQDLERALAYHEAGALRGIASDTGYTAINAAFVLDLLAHEDERLPRESVVGVTTAIARRAAAADHRRNVIAMLTKLRSGGDRRAAEWWFAIRLAEAQFALRDYDSAEEVIEEGLARGRPDEWELEDAAQQLAALARLHSSAGVEQLADSPAWRIVGRLLGSDPAGVRGQFIGKVGLALSGGGFRASLFHIGVLARLAELDLLRHVEVISCVSGGSIVGAHYYLKLKRLLETVPDRAIRRSHYVQLVRELERDFLAGVQRNIRMRLFAELTTNLRMLFQRGFTRTKRAGELYEEEIFARMAGDGVVTERRKWYMTDLFVTPRGEREDFHPLRHNWRRGAKVPVLVLNATTLNTGHGWQFTASWMGEPPGDIDDDVDVNYRLRRLYYHEAPEPYRTKDRVRLGHAVAASAAVPGIFDPLDLPGLFERVPAPGEKRRRPVLVRLVDGGVHDNQGVASLIDQECTVQLVSDASGQIDAIDRPKAGPFSVLLRSASVQGARVRTAQYDTLAARRRPRSLDEPFVVHLKRGLEVEHVDWRDCEEPWSQFGDFPAPRKRHANDETHTFYGVTRRAQSLLAGMRTDLDTFADAEAFALMASGYRMATEDARTSGLERMAVPEPCEPWRFQQIEHALTTMRTEAPAAARLDRLLGAACHRFFRIWRIDALLRVLGILLVAASGIGIAFLMYRHRSIDLLRLSVGRVGVLVLISLGLTAGGTIVKRIRAIVNFEKPLKEYALSAVLAAGGWVLARLHLWMFDRLYLRWGAITRFAGPGASGISRATPDAAGHSATGGPAPSTRDGTAARKP